MDVMEYLSQDKVWIGKDGQVDIASMSTDWRVKAARWLMRHAKSLHIVVCASANESAIDEEISSGIAEVIALVTQNPNAWMRKTPLYEALCAGINLNAYVLVERVHAEG